MTDDRTSSDAGAATSGGAAIQLWRTANRIWPGFPTLLLARAVTRRSPAVGEGGVLSIYLDASKLGTISPEKVESYRVSPGEHTLSLRFLGGLRRSKKRTFTLNEGEKKQFVCFLNRFAWPCIRAANLEDVAALKEWQSHAGES
ncbi:MAG: hypothetical protein WCA31_09765 [Acidimicrobiales bacterium]